MQLLRTLLGDIPEIRGSGNTAIPVGGIADHPRDVHPGTIFVALRGRRADGSQFIPTALGNGAAAVLTRRRPGDWDFQVPLLLAENPRAAMGRLASGLLGHPSRQLRVLGVTGTNGKTTVSTLAHHLLQDQGFRSGLLGTIAYRVGDRVLPSTHTTPDGIRMQGLLADMLHEGQQAVCMEVSSHALDQDRVSGVDFDIAIFTNLTRDHLDYHASWHAYAQCKLKLFDLLNESSKRTRAAVVNADDALIDAIKARLRVPMLSYGTRPGAEILATDMAVHAGGSRFTLSTPMGRREVTLPMAGKFNAANAMAAIGGGMALGLDLDGMVESLAHVPVVRGRMEFLDTGLPFDVVVDYAHTDDGLRHALEALRASCRGRLLVVFGCGGDRDRGKRARMGRIAQVFADKTFLTSDNPRGEDVEAIIRDIAEGFSRRDSYAVCPDRKAAIEEAMQFAGPGDTVLLAGKGHEAFQIVGEERLPFSDHEIAQAHAGVLC